MPILPADLRISLKKRGGKMYGTELIRQPARSRQPGHVSRLLGPVRPTLSDEAAARLKAFVESNDGFRLAEIIELADSATSWARSTGCPLWRGAGRGRRRGRVIREQAGRIEPRLRAAGARSCGAGAVRYGKSLDLNDFG